VKDNSTGLHYAGARYYTAAFGRWTTTDPILGEKGPKALLKQDSRLLTMTSYNYAFDNPLRLTDPTGLAPMDWYRDEEGNIVHDEDVQSQADLEEGQTYLGENVLKYQEDGPTKLLTEGGDRVNVFDKGASKAEQGSKGASGLSVAAARQEAVLTSKWAKGGKSLSSLVEWTGRIAKGGTVASFLLSTGSEVAQGDMRTYEFVKGTVDAGLAYGSYYYGAGAAASFALEVTPAGNGMTAKERGIRFLTRQILEAQVDKVVSQ
jgi:RHS repeat-associated protein